MIEEIAREKKEEAERRDFEEALVEAFTEERVDCEVCGYPASR